MSKDTAIEWSDSSLNLMMGCDGCELWNPKTGVKHCYAGTLTERYGGRKGYPIKFELPVVFADRLEPALRWGDLTGKKRDDKPWLDGLPRIVFLNDMGDTFTESLPLDWLAPFLPRLAKSPHQWLILTKRGRRLREFAAAHPLPPNVWPGVSVTTAPTLRRVAELFEINSGGPKWVSAEPLLEPLPGAFIESPALDWLIVGGESGPGARPCDIAWIRSAAREASEAGVPCFVKQLGGNVSDFDSGVCARDSGVSMHDPKGGDPNEWPKDIRVRQMPQLESDE